MQRIAVRPDFYQQLGLENFASPIEIKRAFRRLALVHHPDRGGDIEKMKILNHIYDVLSQHKAEYDNWLRQQLAPRQEFVFHFSFGSDGTSSGYYSSTTTANGWY